MGLAGHQSERNVHAIAYLALILSFSAFSFFTITVHPVACFGGDIGTNKCPISPNSNCASPPAGNPNACHDFKWLFPNGTQTVPPIGLFNNDTSYYFPLNVTGVVEFSICVNWVSTVELGGFPGFHNDTFTLQFLNSSSYWNDAGPIGGGFGYGQNVPPIVFCQGSPTSFVPNLVSNCQPVTGPGSCEFRIAGSCYEVVFQSACPSAQFPGWEINTFTGLFVEFYSGASAIQGTITCDPQTRSLSSFTTVCIRTFLNGSQSISIGWRSTNATGTGSGCGASDNCIRGPATATCSFAATSNSCSVAVTYSPAFTGTTPIPNIGWSPITGISKTIAPPFVYNLLT